MFRTLLPAGASLILFAGSAIAETGAAPIERVKLTDSELSCAQLYAEVKEMDAIIGTDHGTVEASRQTESNARIADRVAPAAVGVAAATGNYRTAWGFAAAAPVIGLGSQVVEEGAKNKGASAGTRLEDAKERKTHLTQLFVNKGCKMSELAAPAPATPTPSETPAASAPAPAPAQETLAPPTP